jgi:selenide,water dikinase
MTIEARNVPVFGGVLAIAGRNRSGGMGSNQEHFGVSTSIDPGLAEGFIDVLYDPQTSGGLLVAADPASADAVGAAFEAGGVKAARIGVAGTRRAGTHIVVRP